MSKWSPKKALKPRRKSIVIRKRKTKKSLPLFFDKPKENPIISPRPEHEWEAWQTFNPGVILLNDKVHFLYRAIGEDGISRLGYAVSSDGFHLDERLPYPVYEHKVKQHSFSIFSYFSGGSFGGAEDPRLTQVDKEGILYMTYTACDNGLRVGLTSIKVNDFLARNWHWREPKLISPPDEVHKNWAIFPEKINGKYAILHSINPEILIDYVPDLAFRGEDYIKSFHNSQSKNGYWEAWVRGVGAPPIKTRYGWFVFYHALQDHDFGNYKVGAFISDLNDPTKILYRSKEPILEPSESYEKSGHKPGIVYVTGAVVKDGTLLVYYGASDSFVSVAFAPFEEFLKALVESGRPTLAARHLKKKK